MTISACLQDWTTVTGNAGSVLVQPQRDWLQVRSFQDISIYVEIQSCTVNATLLDIQTSVTPDEVMFAASQSVNAYLARFSVGTSSNGVQTVQRKLWSTATDQIPARYVRWKVTFPAGSVTNMTFRIVLAMNQAGWRA